MRVENIQSAAPSSAHQPRGNAHAYGLVRQLQEGTFKGASVEKHLARFADRLSHAPESPEEEVTIPIEVDESSSEEAPTAALPSFDGLGSIVNILA